jgi:AcrR family transcriptional regulator
MASAAVLDGDDDTGEAGQMNAVGDMDAVAGTHAAGEPTHAPVSRRDRRTARTRQAILDAARALIDEQGYGQTTVDQIAERADIAARTFFRHFASKEALLFANFDEHRRIMVEMIKAKPVGEHPLQAVLDGLADFCEVVEADHEQFMWAFRIMEEQDLQYEQSMLKAETSERIGAHLAERLGVDPATDARPHTWAVVALTLFGNAMKSAFGTGGDGRARENFEALVEQTGRCFRHLADPPSC